MQKKIYVAPTITEYGNAIVKTKGMSGENWESFGTGKHDIIIDED